MSKPHRIRFFGGNWDGVEFEVPVCVERVAVTLADDRVLRYTHKVIEEYEQNTLGIMIEERSETVTPDIFYATHKACPQCKSSHVRVTYVGKVDVVGEDFVDDVNSAECVGCGWKGRVLDLVP